MLVQIWLYYLMYNGAVKGVISVRCGVDYIHIFSPYKFIIQLTSPREEIHNLRSRYSKKNWDFWLFLCNPVGVQNSEVVNTCREEWMVFTQVTRLWRFTSCQHLCSVLKIVRPIRDFSNIPGFFTQLGHFHSTMCTVKLVKCVMMYIEN